MRLLLIILGFIILPGQASFAGGFQLNLQGVRNLAMGHVGTGHAFGLSAIHFNPGALAFYEHRFGVTADLHLLRARTLYTEESPGQYYAYNQPGLGTPFSVYVSWMPEKVEGLALGMGVNTPFGSRVAYEEDWKGQFLLRELSLKTIVFQPTVSYKINEKLSIGAGAMITTGDFSLRRAVPVQDQDEDYGEAELAGSGLAFGANVGVYYELNENLTVGASYRSAQQVNVEGGTANFTVPQSLSEFFPSTTFSTKLSLPSVANFGATYSFEKLRLSFDVNYVGWQVYDSLNFDFEENTEKLEDSKSARHYESAPILRLGSAYTLNDKLTLMGGVYYDMSPVQDGYLTPETPDANKIGLTTGATYTAGRFALDVAFLFIEGQERFDKNLESEFAGTWKARAWSLGIGLNYKL